MHSPRRVTRSLVGAGAPANTGEAGAMHRVAGFAGMPAPTGIAFASPLVTATTTDS
ncbi:protein of unknown function [Pseudomonas sp. JV551A1]|uniref:Uncharacterized protein n=1 Tax=Pseudomonas inefficax TaxID=2078786 RepID=A0AAQ1SVR9_9PSED|nr:protein of unknown function [Pseudomonas sp. JV551A1]SPO63181.1 protein of unknown function [Pseudomonas inefficax]